MVRAQEWKYHVDHFGAYRGSPIGYAPLQALRVAGDSQLGGTTDVYTRSSLQGRMFFLCPDLIKSRNII